MSEIFELLEEARIEKGLNKRKFSNECLGVTEDTYNAWQHRFPRKPHKKTRTAICNLLNMTDEDLDLRLSH